MQEVIFWGIWAVLGLIMLLYYLAQSKNLYNFIFIYSII